MAPTIDFEVTTDGSIDVDLGLAAKLCVPVLITGESRCDREKYARLIHGVDATGPFVACRSDDVAVGVKDLFDQASGGSLFIDDIAALTAPAQQELLSLLDLRDVLRSGAGALPGPSTARIMAGASRHLDVKRRPGTFSELLYYRLNIIHIDLMNRSNRRASPEPDMAKSLIRIRATDSILDQMNQLERVISEHAYALFRDRDGLFGDAVTDWLTAERAVVWKPAIELRQKDSHVEILAALPGVDAKDVDVEVTPEDVLIKADVDHERTADAGTVQVCEFGHGKAFRSVHLPASIDPRSVKAEYRNGLLRLTAAVAPNSQLS